MTLTEVQSNNALSSNTSPPPEAVYNGIMQMDIWEEDYSYLIVPDSDNAFMKVSTTDLSLIDSYTGFYPCRQGAVIDQKTETYYGFAFEDNKMGSCNTAMTGNANNYYGPAFGYHEGLVDNRRGPGQGYVIAIDNEDRFCVIDISSDNLDMDSEPDHAYYYLDGNPGGGGTYTLAESYLSSGTVLSTTHTLDSLPSKVEAYIDADVTANTDVVLTISDGTNSIQISYAQAGQEIDASSLTSTDITVEVALSSSVGAETPTFRGYVLKFE